MNVADVDDDMEHHLRVVLYCISVTSIAVDFTSTVAVVPTPIAIRCTVMIFLVSTPTIVRTVSTLGTSQYFLVSVFVGFKSSNPHSVRLLH